MPLTTNINAYADVSRVLEAARNAGGARFTLPSARDAVRWRQRAYQYRKLLYQRRGHTPYDMMQLTLDGETVIIQFRDVTGALTSLEGEPLKEEETDEEWLEAAEQFVKNLEKK